MPSTWEDFIVPDELLCSPVVNNCQISLKVGAPHKSCALVTQALWKSVHSEVCFTCAQWHPYPTLNPEVLVHKTLVTTSSQGEDIWRRNEKFTEIKLFPHEQWNLGKRKTAVSWNGQEALPLCFNFFPVSSLPTSFFLFPFLHYVYAYIFGRNLHLLSILVSSQVGDYHSICK